MFGCPSGPVDTRGAEPFIEQGYWANSRQKVPSSCDLSNVTQLKMTTKSKRFLCSFHFAPFEAYEMKVIIPRVTKGKARASDTNEGSDLKAVNTTVFANPGFSARL